MESRVNSQKKLRNENFNCRSGSESADRRIWKSARPDLEARNPNRRGRSSNLADIVVFPPVKETAGRPRDNRDGGNRGRPQGTAPSALGSAGAREKARSSDRKCYLPSVPAACEIHPLPEIGRGVRGDTPSGRIVQWARRPRHTPTYPPNACGDSQSTWSLASRRRSYIKPTCLI